MNTEPLPLDSQAKNATKAFTRATRAFMTYVEEADLTLRLAVHGISRIRGSTRLLAAVERLNAIDQSALVDGELPAETQKKIKEAEELERLAALEVENGFPLLHAHTVVAMWSALEAALPRVAEGWLIDEPSSLKRPAFEKIRIPVGALEDNSRQEIVAYIIQALLEAQKPHQPGVARYENIFDAIGLGGGLSETLRRDLYELSQVRNLLVHQFGVVDSKFASACPWLELKIGERFQINTKEYLRYRDVPCLYMTEVLDRAIAVRKVSSASGGES